MYRVLITYAVAEYTLHISYVLAQALWNPLYVRKGEGIHHWKNKSSNAIFQKIWRRLRIYVWFNASTLKINRLRFLPIAKS